MAELTLRQAAREAGISKSSLLRMVKDGRISAVRDEGGRGTFRIDVSELRRVFPEDRSRLQSTTQDGAVIGASAGTIGAVDTVEFRIRAASLEAQVAALRELADELRQDRDRWHGEAASWKGQAERLALAPPRRASWWWKWRAAG